MMKKKSFLLIILLISLNNAFAQIIDYDIIGVYLPVDYIETLERTKHNPVSWAHCKENYFNTVYIVDTYSITASGRYDGEKNIFVWDIFKFKFEYIDGNIFLTDDKNNRFRKIPGELYEFEDWSDIVSNFIGRIILEKLIKSGDIILENDLVTFPSLDNKVFRIQWQAYDPREKRNLHLEGVTNFQENLTLEIRSNEYIFYGYHYFATDIVWSYFSDEIDVFPTKTDFYGVWTNDLDIKHIISADEWTFLSPNGNTYTMSNLIWTRARNNSESYPYGYSITGTVISVKYNGPTFLSVGFTRTVRYFMHETDKTKIVADNNPDHAAYFSKTFDTDE
jgi:hypothetical protein